jgi:hypothetical protein
MFPFEILTLFSVEFRGLLSADVGKSAVGAS